jgi:hypothetical protein
MSLKRPLMLNQKDSLELKWWKTADQEYQRNKMLVYLEEFGLGPNPKTPDVLEIGTGPLLGLLPYFNAPTRVGIDPLLDIYQQEGLLPAAEAAKYSLFSVPFETWTTSYRYHTIVSADALDHGDMGFQLVPKIAGLLAPGGRFYLHVHLRPKELLNLIHDHQLTQAQLNTQLSQTDLIQEKRVILPHDVDGQFCETLVGIWQKPL